MGPRANWIAFNRGRSVCEEHLRVGRRTRTDRSRARAADPPCDEGDVALTSIYVVRRNGRGLRRVARARGTRGRYRNDEKLNPVWSPDGRQLAFIWNYGERADLYVISARGGRQRRLAKGIDPLGGASWQALPRSQSGVKH